MKKKKTNSIKNQYKQSFNYIKECKKFIFAIIIIFFIFSLIGFFVPASPEIEEAIKTFIQELIEKTKDMSQTELISFIFTNNIQSSFFGMIFGVVFGVFPIITTIANGYILGYVASVATEAESILSLWRILPHGIFELPAIFISLGLGLKLGLWLIAEPIKFYWNKNKLISFLFILFYLPALIIALIKNKSFKKRMVIHYHLFISNTKNSIKTFILVIIPLLIIAAIIEGILISLTK